MLRGIILAVVIGALGFGVLIGGLVLGGSELFYYDGPDPAPYVTANEADRNRQDAAYFTQFPNYDRSYAPAARAEADRLANALVSEANTLSRAALHLRIAEIAALADNTHTGLGISEMRKFANQLPVRFYWFIDGLHILRAKAGHENLLGARIDRIEGQSIEKLFERLKKYAGGPENFRRGRMAMLLESPQLLHAAGVAMKENALFLSGVSADGSPLTVQIEAEPSPGENPLATRYVLFPISEEGEQRGWRSFLHRDAEGPISTKGTPQIFRMAKIPADGLYVRLAANVDTAGEEIAPFVAKAETAIRESRLRYVIVDLRFNGGGDYTNTYDFASSLPEMVGPEARIYLLTSVWTGSAAITTTGALKQAGGKRVTIVGEPVGDRLRFYAEGNAFCLPNSGACLGFATAMHDYSQFCSDLTRCFWLNYLYPVEVSTVDPEIYAFISFEEYRNGRDPALDAVFAREGAMAGAVRLEDVRRVLPL
jgi:hypothetical protein